METEIVGGAVKGLTGLWEYGGLVTVLVLIDIVMGFVIWGLFTRNQAMVDRLFQLAMDGQKAMNEFSNQMNNLSEKVDK